MKHHEATRVHRYFFKRSCSYDSTHKLKLDLGIKLRYSRIYLIFECDVEE